jgi:hypothetical protein
MAPIRARTTRGSAFAACLTTCLALAIACQGEEESRDANTSGSGQGASGGTGGTSADGSGGTGAGDAATDAEGGPGGNCDSDPEDDPCTACLKVNCCSEWQTCRAEQACTTCTDCLAEEQDLGTCNFTSGTCMFTGTGDPTAQVLSCGLTACEIECGFS